MDEAERDAGGGRGKREEKKAIETETIKEGEWRNIECKR